MFHPSAPSRLLCQPKQHFSCPPEVLTKKLRLSLGADSRKSGQGRQHPVNSLKFLYSMFHGLRTDGRLCGRTKLRGTAAKARKKRTAGE